jgi:hypothetical protein
MSLKDLVEDDGNEELSRKLASMEPVEPEPVQEPQSPAPAQPQPDPLIAYARRAGNYAAQKEREVRQAGQQLTKVQSALTKEKKLVATLKKQIPKKPIAPAPPTPPRQAPRREPAVLRPSAKIGNPGKGKTSMRNTNPGKSVSFGGNVPSSLPGRIGKKRRY